MEAHAKVFFFFLRMRLQESIRDGLRNDQNRGYASPTQREEPRCPISDHFEKKASIGSPSSASSESSKAINMSAQYFWTSTANSLS